MVDDLKLTDPTTFRAQQVNIILALRERVQNPPIGEFGMEDLVWTDHVTTGSGLHRGSKLAVILCERLDSFIFGEEHHPLYPCRFNAQVIRQNLPNSLRSPRAHRAALVVRFDLLPSKLHCLWFSTLIFLLRHFLDYHSLIKLFAHVFHWHSCVIRKGLHAHPCHSGIMTHHLVFCCVNHKHQCNFGPEDKSEIIGITRYITWMTMWITCVCDIPCPKL